MKSARPQNGRLERSFGNHVLSDSHISSNGIGGRDDDGATSGRANHCGRISSVLYVCMYVYVSMVRVGTGSYA